MMEIIKNIATVVGCISAIIALLITCFKPIRSWFKNYITNKIESNTITEQRKDILKYLPELDKKMDKMAEQNEEIIKRVDKIESRVLLNEQDRLRSELYNCGNRCRRKIPLYPEEYDHIREVYQKYNLIGGNHGAILEFDFITNYYNTQPMFNN